MRPPDALSDQSAPPAPLHVHDRNVTPELESTSEALPSTRSAPAPLQMSCSALEPQLLERLELAPREEATGGPLQTNKTSHISTVKSAQ